MEHEIKVIPNLVQTKMEYDKKIREGVDEKNIFVLSKQPCSKKVFKGHILPCVKYTNILPVLAKGTILGLILGAILFALTWTHAIPIELTRFETLYPLILTILVSIWVASLIGVTNTKKEFEGYMRYINQGWTMMVVEHK